MNINNSLIEEYIDKMSSDESEILASIARETYLHEIHPRMISGKVQGHFLNMISSMIKPDRILEVGTFTAYATVCLALGLSDKGKIITIEIKPELEDTIISHLEKAGIKDKTKLIIGNALEIIPKLNETFDLVFIDGDKGQYIDYFKAILPLVRPGGIILVDNVLWNGKIIDQPDTFDRETRGITDFNKYIQSCPETDVVIIPLRDGVSMIRKK